MSDSGRCIGDCKHGKTPDWCPHCLRERVRVQDAALDELRRLSAALAERCAGQSEALSRRAEGLQRPVGPAAFGCYPEEVRR